MLYHSKNIVGRRYTYIYILCHYITYSQEVIPSRTTIDHVKVRRLQDRLQTALEECKKLRKEERLHLFNLFMKESLHLLPPECEPLKEVVEELWISTTRTLLQKDSHEYMVSSGVQTTLPLHCSHPPSSLIHNSDHLAALEQIHVNMKQTLSYHKAQRIILQEYQRKLDDRHVAPDVCLVNDRGDEEVKRGVSIYIKAGNQVEASGNSVYNLLKNVIVKSECEVDALRNTNAELERKIEELLRRVELMERQLEATGAEMYETHLALQEELNIKDQHLNEIEALKVKLNPFRVESTSQTNLAGDFEILQPKKTRSKHTQTVTSIKSNRKCLSEEFEEFLHQANKSRRFRFTTTERIDKMKGKNR